jgi:hypothetical protein
MAFSVRELDGIRIPFEFVELYLFVERQNLGSLHCKSSLWVKTHLCVSTYAV